MNPFLVILSRNGRGIKRKIDELEKLGYPYKIICGEKISHPGVVYREARGKWDAINYSEKFIPSESDTVVINDADTKIVNFEKVLSKINDNDLVYSGIEIPPSTQFGLRKFEDLLRNLINFAPNGDLMIFRRKLFNRILPLPPCVAEDSYMLFKAMELGSDIDFFYEDCIKTTKTSNLSQEKKYKERTTLGIYQALGYTHPPPHIKSFYMLLPLFASLLSIFGKKGRTFAKGIFEGYLSYRLGCDKSKF